MINIETGFTSEQLEQILDVFTSPGWKLIQHDMKLYKKQMDSVINIQTAEELYKLKGEIGSLEWFINLQEWYQAAEAYAKDL
ncbi:MAG: hypothetical protein HKP52_02920 [Desulfofustis sp.]|nr:hypothetical protein [Desulfofustis sp.]